MSRARWPRRGGLFNRLVGLGNRSAAWVFALGVRPDYLVALDVTGRRSGHARTVPLVMAVVGSERYLVSMLGEDVNWVQNQRAANGKAVLRHGRREEIRLEDVPMEMRPVVLKAYLKRAVGARPHIPVHKDAPLSEFAKVAPRIPVFRVTAGA